MSAEPFLCSLRRAPRLVGLAAAVLSAVPAFGYVTDEFPWPAGTVTYTVRLGAPSFTLIDGSSTWKEVFDHGLGLWNTKLHDIQLLSTDGAPGGQADGNDRNDIFFSDTFYGDSYGGALAITLSSFITSRGVKRRVEADIGFNSAFSWNSYRGNLRSPEDFLRVALHEVGHSIGLDHPDDDSQSVEAIMNSQVSNLDTLAQDDIDGAAALYGAVSSGGGGSNTARLANLSVLTNAGGQFGTLILGLTTSAAVKPLLIRGVGPTLESFDVTSVLPDPTITLFNLQGTQLTTNDNWGDNGGATSKSTVAARVGAFPLESDLEAALLVIVNPDNYTVHVHDTQDRSGKVLIEAYDSDQVDPPAGRFINLSTQTEVGGAAGLLTAGFVISGTGKLQLLIRGIGPRLSDFGVTGVLPDPRIKLIGAGQQEVASNDDWQDTNGTAIAAAAAKVGAFSLNNGSLDASLLIELDPGIYSVQLEDAVGGSGRGMIEIYEVVP